MPSRSQSPLQFRLCTLIAVFVLVGVCLSIIRTPHDARPLNWDFCLAVAFVTGALLRRAITLDLLVWLVAGRTLLCHYPSDPPRTISHPVLSQYHVALAIGLLLITGLAIARWQRRSPLPRRATITWCAIAAFAAAMATPVARITKSSCDRLLPGMTLAEAAAVIGGPPGVYDGAAVIAGLPDCDSWPGGVWDTTAGEPPRPRETGPGVIFWIGGRGAILLQVDNSSRARGATYYRTEVRKRSILRFAWERVSRANLRGFSRSQRAVVTMALMLLSIVFLGMARASAGGANCIANHGGIGILAGMVVPLVLFADKFLSDLDAMLLILSGPLVGAAIGLAVGVCRKTWAARQAIPPDAIDALPSVPPSSHVS